MSNVGGGRLYWVQNHDDDKAATTTTNQRKVKGIVAVFGWAVSIRETQLENYTNLYSSLGWNSLVCLSDFLTPYILERATTLAYSTVCELIEELRCRPCPLVLAAFSGGSKACMYKVLQIIEGVCEAQLNQEDSQLLKSCISGQIYDSGPVDFTSDLGARFTLPQIVLKMPGSAKLVSMFAKGVTSGLDALFLTKFGSQRTDYWHVLCSSVRMGAPVLILCSENDDLAPCSVICKFARCLEDSGANVKVVKWNSSPHLGHYNHHPTHYRASVTEMLEQALSIFSYKIQRLGERAHVAGMPDEIADLICDLQTAAVDSNQSFGRVAVGPNDHFFLPSSAGYQNNGDSGPLQEERKENSHQCANPSINAHSVLGQILFDACVPKNIEGWDIKFSGSLNGQPFASASKRSPLHAIKRIGRARL